VNFINNIIPMKSPTRRSRAMESMSSLRHLAFFEELAKLDERDQGWRSVSAGLVVMRLIDQWTTIGTDAVRSDAWGVTAVREAISELPDTTPLRRILSAIVECLVSCDVGVHALVPRLMAYGQSLEYEARWAIAADIYETVVALADPVEDADLVVSAFLQLAFCRRMLADFDRAAGAYTAAASVAHAAGDLIGVLRGRIGDAKIAIARGNMPMADEILQEAVERARVEGLDDVRARAIHERAIVAGLSGRHKRAVHLAYEALGVAPVVPDRDRILNNIATGLRYLGLHDAARDAYLVLAVTTQEQYVRWLSELNLMELAAAQGIGLQFDKYRRDLESADFSPDLRVTYLLHVGRGYHSLGSPETGIPYLEEAIKVASDHKLNQLIFECEAALRDAKRRPVRRDEKVSSTVEFEMRAVVDGLQSMRRLAGIA
jgi:tetratricopeptide (TPR) repeat protein